MASFLSAPRSSLLLHAASWAAVGVFVGQCSCGASQPAADVSAPAQVASAPAQAPAPTGSASPQVVSVASDTDEPAQARTTVQGTINQAIALLRSHDYRTLIEQFVDPSDLAKFNAREGGTESLTKEFGGSEKPKRLLDLLLSIQGASPELTEDGDEAIFHADPSTNPAHGGEIRFHRVHGLWYLRD